MLDALRELGAASSRYRQPLLACLPYIDRLAEDYGPGANLSCSVMVALADRLGMPAYVERSVRSILCDLDQATHERAMHRGERVGATLDVRTSLTRTTARLSARSAVTPAPAGNGGT